MTTPQIKKIDHLQELWENENKSERRKYAAKEKARSVNQTEKEKGRGVSYRGWHIMLA